VRVVGVRGRCCMFFVIVLLYHGGADALPDKPAVAFQLHLTSVCGVPGEPYIAVDGPASTLQALATAAFAQGLAALLQIRGGEGLADGVYLGHRRDTASPLVRTVLASPPACPPRV